LSMFSFAKNSEVSSSTGLRYPSLTKISKS
jgi:hypothetical protein